LIHQLAAHDRRIIETNLIAETLLLVKVKHDGAAVVRKLLKSAMLDGIKLVAAVSEDVDIHDQESYIWGVFTRFDCERDVNFTQQKLVGYPLFTKESWELMPLGKTAIQNRLQWMKRS